MHKWLLAVVVAVVFIVFVSLLSFFSFLSCMSHCFSPDRCLTTYITTCKCWPRTILTPCAGKTVENKWKSTAGNCRQLQSIASNCRAMTPSSTVAVRQPQHFSCCFYPILYSLLSRGRWHVPPLSVPFHTIINSIFTAASEARKIKKAFFFLLKTEEKDGEHETLPRLFKRETQVRHTVYVDNGKNGEG